MQKFIGFKLVIAVAMTRLAYIDYRGWQLPENEDGADDGYLVESLGGGKSNHPDHVGYISWLQAEQFNAAYHPTEGMTFGLAIEALKHGERVARAGWNGRGMWLVLIHPGNAMHTSSSGSFNMQPCIGMKTAQGTMQPGWLASQTDMLADDWIIVGSSPT